MNPTKKEGRYRRLTEQLVPLLKKSPDRLARMATLVAVLKNKIDYYYWCGFYRLEGDMLHVGPYQGTVACQVLEGGGVCLEAVKTGRTVVVPDVDKFPGHIACDSLSKSEIVVPVYDAEGNLYAVLDVDSRKLNSFDGIDALYLEQLVQLI